MDKIEPLNDAALMAALHESAFETAWGTSAFADLMRKSGARAFGTADGFILMQPLGEEAEIVTLAVRPAARRAGLAGRLIAHARTALAAQTIFLEVAADNHAARALYKKCGFHETGRRKAYYKRTDGLHVDAVLMQY